MILLGQGCDIFARNIEAKTPKKVCLCNFVFSKLLSHFEFVRLREKYDKNEENDNNLRNTFIDNNNKEIKKDNDFLDNYSSLKNNKINNNFLKNNNNEILKREKHSINLI